MQKITFSAQNPRASLACPGTDAQLSWQDGTLTVRLRYRGAYGMGEKYNRLNQKGLAAVNEVREQFCFQQDKTYCSAPFFLTDTGFGLYVDTCGRTEFQFDEEQISVRMPAAPVVLFSGAPRQIIAAYMSLFGAAVLPPRWALGVWISANRWNTQQQAEAQLAALQRYRFPAAVLVLEAWSDEATFSVWNGARYTPRAGGGALEKTDFDFSGSPWPDPEGMIRRLHAAGLRLVLWQVPVYKKQDAQEVPNVQNDLDRADAVQKGLCVRRTDGTPYTIPAGSWFAGSLIPDFTNAVTKAQWFARRRYLLDMGVDGFKTDGGEFIRTADVQFANGSAGAEGQNRYARDYTGSYRDFIGPERVLFSRAGFAGQHTVPIHWAGDQQSQNSELRAVLCAGLSAAMTGIPFWGFDIAGFAGPLPTPDLYRRATQMACFCPVMQWHSEPDGGQFRALMPGAEGNNERSPWNMANAYNIPEFLDEMRFWHWLRVNLEPYLGHTARQCVQQSMPMLRPLVYEWPQDAACAVCEDEYLLGDSLLAAPLLAENAQGRDVYLPQGTWVCLFSGRQAAGGQTVRWGGGGRLPVFVRAGCALPLCLGKTRTLGEPPERRGAGAPLHFLLAGAAGSTAFSDGAGNDFSLCWANGAVTLAGEHVSEISWAFL